jgi:CHAD domain-containing protein
MSDYLLPEGASAAAASRAIAAVLDVRGGRLCSDERAYYDTFDGLLHAAGLVAVWEKGELALIERDSDRIRAREALSKPTSPLFARDLPDGRLSEALTELIDLRALLPVVQVRCRERPLDVVNRDGKTVVRLRVQQPTLGRRRLRGRVHAAAVRGYESAYRRVGQTFETQLGFQPAPSLVDEAVLAAGGSPGGVSARIDVALAPEQRADTAAALILGALLQVIEDNRDGAIADLDSEFLHDLRVAVRRSRAVQRELRGVFPPRELPRFRLEFRWLQQATGDARDLDVHVLEFGAMRALVPEPAQGELEPVLAVLRARRSAAHRRTARALRSERMATLLAQWRGLLDRLEELRLEDRPDAAQPIARLAARRIAKVYRRMVKMGEAIDPLGPAQDYHELRKQGKELRYLLELLGAPLYPDEVVRPMVKALKALQDVLGRHQDREIQVALLRSLGPEVSAAADGPAALMAMGMLVERLEADKLAAQEAFAERFAAFAAKPQRRLVRDTFA